MQPPLRTNRQFIAIYSAAITANAPSRVFNTVLHETRNTGPEGGRGKGEGKNLLETVRVRPLLVVHRFSLICLQSAKRAVSFLFPLNSLHRFIHIYIYTRRALLLRLLFPFVVNYFPAAAAAALLLHVESKRTRVLFACSYPPFLFSRVILVNGKRSREILSVADH